MIVSCLLSVFSRSSLNIIDRYLFGKKKLPYVTLYLSIILLPFFYGTILVVLCKNVSVAIGDFLSLNCFLMALATNLAGLSFTHAFRHKDVRHIVLHTKIPELLLPFLLILPFFSKLGADSLTWKNTLLFALMWIGFIPYFLEGKHKTVLLDRAAFFLCSTMLFQMIISVKIGSKHLTGKEMLAFTIAVLLWRCVLSAPLYLFNKQEPNQQFLFNALPKAILSLILFRGVLALLTQFTFNWAITHGSPLLVWPILNSPVILSSVASQILLKEKIYKTDWIALSGVFTCSCIAHIF